MHTKILFSTKELHYEVCEKYALSIIWVTCPYALPEILKNYLESFAGESK